VKRTNGAPTEEILSNETRVLGAQLRDLAKQRNKKGGISDAEFRRRCRSAVQEFVKKYGWTPVAGRPPSRRPPRWVGKWLRSRRPGATGWSGAPPVSGGLPSLGKR
jgi:hypothetical protein